MNCEQIYLESYEFRIYDPIKLLYQNILCAKVGENQTHIATTAELSPHINEFQHDIIIFWPLGILKLIFEIILRLSFDLSKGSYFSMEIQKNTGL